MKKLWILCICLGFQGVFAAAPSNQKTRPIEKKSPTTYENEKVGPPTTEGASELERNALQNTSPPDDAPQPSSLSFFYGHTRSISTYGGAVYLAQTGLIYGLGGLSYMFHSQTRFHFEGAFDALGTLESHIRAMGKWYFKIADRLRPYYNIGLGIRMMSQDNIAVILSWPRLLVQTGAGVEWSFSQDFSLRAEGFANADLSNNSNVGAWGGVTVGF